jgi:hypothetical protein
MDSFEYVWMATNGSRKKHMMMLSNIMDGEVWGLGDEYTGRLPQHDGHLCVALSVDGYHDHRKVDPEVWALWHRRAIARGYMQFSPYELRNVDMSMSGVMNKGRAKRNGIGQNEQCACPDLLINPDGDIKACGCPDAPVIGDIWDFNGYPDDWKFGECWREQETEVLESCMS